jgi:predicted flap endonuclease-1-like 5' DNA nuclease/Trp operon repressor
MHFFLGLFDPGWRNLPVSVANTEITLIWILAGLLGALLYYLFLGRKAKVSIELTQKFEHLTQELQDEKNRQHKLKQQLEAAQAKANSFSDKLKHKLHDVQKELEATSLLVSRHKTAFEDEHARVTSMMVDHSEVESLKNRVKNQEKELNGSRDEIARLKGSLESALSDKVRLTASLDESQVNEMRSKIQRLENDLHSSRLMVVKFQTEATRFEEDRKRFLDEKASVDGQSNETESLRHKMGQLEADLQKARQGLADVAALKSELQAVKTERDNWNQEADVQANNAASALASASRVSELEGMVGLLKGEKQKLSADLDVALTEKATIAEALAKASGPIKPDNLKVIEGIGPKLEEILNSHRIYTFGQLSETSIAVLQGILDEQGDSYKIHDPGTWPEQATLLSEGKLEAFEKLTEELKGGRRVE